MKGENLFYYSVNSYLAHYINENFYKGCHYIWCSPVFDCMVLEKSHPYRNIPSSSNPKEIYISLLKDVDRLDLHSTKILENKRGLRRGAAAQRKINAISDAEYKKILDFIKIADWKKFTPLLYIIPRELVKGKIEMVSPKKAANPFSTEYKILNLKTNEFDYIELPKLL